MAKKMKHKTTTYEPKEEIVQDYLLLIKEDKNCKHIEQLFLGTKFEENIEVWIELDLLEITLNKDTLVFENILETFDTKEDKEILNNNEVKMVYAISYMQSDIESVKEILTIISNHFDIKIASDTFDFEPFISIDDL